MPLNKPSRSRSTSPIHGFDNKGRPVSTKTKKPAPLTSITEVSPIKEVVAQHKASARELRAASRVLRDSASSTGTEYPVGSPASQASIDDLTWDGYEPEASTLPNVDETLNARAIIDHHNVSNVSTEEFHEAESRGSSNESLITAIPATPAILQEIDPQDLLDELQFELNEQQHTPAPLSHLPGQPESLAHLPGQPAPPAPLDHLPGQTAPLAHLPGQPAPLDHLPGQTDPLAPLPGQPAPLAPLVNLPGQTDPLAPLPGQPSITPINLPYSTPPTMNLSQLTNLSQEARAIARTLMECKCEWEDDFCGLQAASVPEAMLPQLMQQAERLKKKINTAIMDAELGHPDLAETQLVADAPGYKRGVIIFIRSAISTMREREVQEKERTAELDKDPAKEVKLKRVTDNQDEVIDNLVTMIRDLDVFDSSTPPTNKPDLILLEERVSAAKEKATSLVETAQSLLNDATDVGLADEASTIDKHIREVKKKLLEKSAHMADRKVTMGIYSTSATVGATHSDVPPPTFSGGTNPDYFTFLRNWNQYLGTKMLSEDEKLLILTKKCLKGTAFSVSERYDNLTDILAQLKIQFGNPRLLYSTRVEELKKLGPCQGSDQAKRTWLVDIRAKLSEIEKIAADHGLENAVHLHQLVGVVQGFLPQWMLREFHKKAEAKDASGNLSAADAWTIMLTTLDLLINKTTFAINIGLNLGNAANAPATQPAKPSGKNGKNTAYTVNPGSAPPLSAGNGPPPPATKAISAPVTSVQKGQTKKGKAKREKAKDNSELHISAHYVPPSETLCTVCQNTHTHAYYCEEYQRAREKERVSLAARMRCCFRCLRLDAVQTNDKEQRDAWYETHRINCKTDWVCTQGKCEKMKGRFQWHFTLCTFHTAENKAKQSDFVKQLRADKIGPGISFFFNMPSLSYQLSAPPIASPSEDDINECALPDVNAASIFMLQNIEVNGQQLLVFYDSGCGGAALNDRAAKLLKSRVIRPGPTTLNVAGARSFKIDGGDESFTLALHDSKYKATITGLHMDAITTKFPLWKVSEAWPDILADIRTTQHSDMVLPNAPKQLGGKQVDIMIGIRYLKYYPTMLFMLPSGLGIFKSQFKAPNNEILVLGGPHPAWSKCAETCSFVGPHSFFSAEFRAYYSSRATLRHVYTGIEHVGADQLAKLDFIEDNAKKDFVPLISATGGPGPRGPAQIAFTPTEREGESSCAAATSDTYPFSSALVDYSDCPLLEWIDRLYSQMDSEGINDDEDELMELEREQACYLDMEDDLLGDECAQEHCDIHASDAEFVIPPDWDCELTAHSLRDSTNRYLEGELAGGEIAYRCVRCRNCVSCRSPGRYEASSLKEEAEQYAIEESVHFDPGKKKLIATLPFIKPPELHLKPNRYGAEKVLESQMKLVVKSEQMRQDVLKSFAKLADKGYFLPLSSLPAELQRGVDQEGSHIIPWRVVFKEGSLSTPCRMVFDASATTPGGLCLNDCLAKGENTLIRIHDILLRFRSKPSAFCTDIRQAYNQCALDPSCYRFQQFLWKDELLPGSPTATWVIATLIYGVRPSGNQTAAGFKKLADYCIEKYPEHVDGATALKESTYVDDVVHSGKDGHAVADTARSLDFTLKLAGMEVKSYTFSGQRPAEDVSSDGVHVGLVGLQWDPLQDILAIDIKPLYFGRPRRGKLPAFVEGPVLPALKANFTKRNLLSKVAGVYDPLGLATPVTSRFKLDLHNVVKMGVDWDQQLPDSDLDTWVRNLGDIQELANIRFRRSVIHPLAESTKVDLIVSCDASQDIAVAVVHARMKLKTGGYSCQLIGARSKLVSELTVPKAELRGAVLATHLAHCVKNSFGDQVQSTIYLSDSSITLYWLSQDERPLGVMVRNCVIEVRRFTAPDQWFHVPTDLNIADLGTRFATVQDIEAGSDWQNGPSWMAQPTDKMPIKTIEDVKLSGEEKRVAFLDLMPPDIQGIQLPVHIDKVSERYAFCNYLVDPNKYGWYRAIRVTGLVFRAIFCFYLKAKKTIKLKWFPPFEGITDRTVLWARDKPVLSSYQQRIGEFYYYYKSTLEVDRFTSPKELVHTDRRGGILYSTGRILYGQEVAAPEDVMFDVDHLCFVRPVVDRYSPVAMSVMIYVHTQIAHHRSAVATLRASRDIVYVVRGRDLAVRVREGCYNCTRYKKKLLQTEMGKVHQNRLTIAPPFYHAQVDLFGPMLARCEHNHRSTIKVYGTVFKCPATCAVAVHVMNGYSTDSFIAAYTRFAAKHGNPVKLFIDQGSQLMHACRTMEISMTDVANNLAKSYQVGIEFQTCPVSGHNAHGQVERSIKTIKTLFERVYKSLKLDSFGYETAFAWITMQLNNLPICLGTRIDNLDHLEVITPSRLILGRSSVRALDGPVTHASPGRIAKQMEDVYRSWWETWQREKIADFIPKPPGWLDGNSEAKVGDVVLMLQGDQDKSLGKSIWKLGRIRSLDYSADGISRSAVIEYRNDGETDFRTTHRALSSVAIIFSETDIDFVQEMNRAAKQANIAFIMSQ